MIFLTPLCPFCEAFIFLVGGLGGQLCAWSSVCKIHAGTLTASLHVGVPRTATLEYALLPWPMSSPEINQDMLGEGDSLKETHSSADREACGFWRLTEKDKINPFRELEVAIYVC